MVIIFPFRIMQLRKRSDYPQNLSSSKGLLICITICLEGLKITIDGSTTRSISKYNSHDSVPTSSCKKFLEPFI